VLTEFWKRLRRPFGWIRRKVRGEPPWAQQQQVNLPGAVAAQDWMAGTVGEDQK
jgi:hypothetical protein